MAFMAEQSTRQTKSKVLIHAVVASATEIVLLMERHELSGIESAANMQSKLFVISGSSLD